MLNKKTIHYTLAQADRIGQLAGEMFCLFNLYSSEEYDFEITIPSFELMPRINKALYDMLLRNVKVKFVDNMQRAFLFHMDSADKTKQRILQKDENVYVCMHPIYLRDKLIRSLRVSKPSWFLQLNDEDHARGQQLKDELGMPRDAKVVTLHVRESGYLPGMKYHSYRDADIENYIPAINFLIDKGYYVVRLGDPSMKNIFIESDKFIDAAHLLQGRDFLDVYAIAISSFYVGIPSGPYTLARVMGKPILSTNSILNNFEWGFAKDIWMPKKYFYKDELMNYRSMAKLLPLNMTTTKAYTAESIRLEENTSDELLAAVEEMHNCISGCGNQERKLVHKKFMSMNREIAKTIRKAGFSYYGKALSDMQISNSFLNINPGFFE